MAFTSSPVAYPPSSSLPQQDHNPRKRVNEEPGPAPKKRLFKKDFATTVSTEQTTLKPTGVALPSPVDDSASGNPFAEDDREDSESIGSIEPVQEVTPAASQSLEKTSYRTCQSSKGKRSIIRRKESASSISYEKLIAQRSTTEAGKATKSYYGIDIHRILQDAKELNALKEAEAIVAPEPEILTTIEEPRPGKKQKYPLWTEKYRARKFTDLVGDERTHRSVLRWLKSWDSIVFPGSSKPKIKQGVYEDNEERIHRKILMLTGPPGLGKTTLAHVCAKQAGYEVVEINASDERSRDVVRGKIKDCVGTENVRGINTQIGDSTIRKAGKPVCVVVDEVDGVVSGSGGGGEGGFIKALIDLVLLDQKNTKLGATQTNTTNKQKKVDKFRLLRPMILICNDVYHPSLRPLRQSGLAEIVHVRKPALEKIVTRMKYVFEKENIPADTDAVRRLCEATWGIASRKDRLGSAANGEGDIRGVLVVGQSVASRLRASTSGSETPRLTRQWLEKHILGDLANGGSAARGMGRGGVKETVDRIFLEDGGFPRSSKTYTEDSIPCLAIGKSKAGGVAEIAKANTISQLRTAVEQCGEHDRIVSDLFTGYPIQSFQDDTFLTKPNQAYEWLHFHDSVSLRVHQQQEWELGPYLSQASLAFHNLFASAKNSLQYSAKDVEKEVEDELPVPFSGPRADFSYHEAQKASHANLQTLQNSLSINLYRTFRSPQELSTDLVPHLNRLLSPDVKPVLIGASGEQKSIATVRRETERDKVRRAAEAMAATGVAFERTRIEDENARGGYGGFIFRMEPPVDTLATYATSTATAIGTTSRYAVRQVLDQELSIFKTKQAASSRLARSGGVESTPVLDNDENANAQPVKVVTTAVKRDFFGRVLVNEEYVAIAPVSGKKNSTVSISDAGRCWVTFNEGFSNAVKKPITLRELMEGL